MAVKSYHEEENQKNTVKLREMLDEMPLFTDEYFRSISSTTSVKTRLGYALDLKIFFNYVIENHEKLKGKSIFELEYKDLDEINADFIDKFLEYVSLYESFDNEKITRSNKEKGKARKLAALRSMYKYFYKREKIKTNPPSLVDAPKIHNKNIVRLEVDEVVKLLDEVEFGNNLTEHQKAYHKKNKFRDLAIVSMLVGTGMRVSECVGINISDINFDVNGVKITRKGGNEVILYFGDEVLKALNDYLEFRKENMPEHKNVDALFITSKGERISVRSVQNLVKKYSDTSVKIKNISPHKLRSTYGTNLYRETGDIYLVADVLGHADVNTTKTHYAEMEDQRRKSAPKYIKLRKE